jgi:hypothetical protein
VGRHGNSKTCSFLVLVEVSNQPSALSSEP